MKRYPTGFIGLVAVALLTLTSPLHAQLLPANLSDRLLAQAPDLNPQVLNKALAAMQCATSNGLEGAERLAVIDFSLPSSEKRLWIFDLNEQRLLLEDLVAHGNRSGDNFATDFSNTVGSHQSSLGLFRTQESYVGRHGYSLRMDGLEPGVNDKARERAIVIHAADYVDPSWVDRQGRIGRSQGCPAVRQDVVELVVDNLKGGQLLFTYYPDQEWLNSSAFLNCQPQRVASYVAPFGNRSGS
ncbi:murein L,D-transpeptidase catalytic domain family protein [Nitrincola sp.]|uniref:murein L,D-transpeptidase catalytic domain family protein n=1 Tax=Nitrincola sp. TaxID=1926584 RepID=UPI003A929A06